MKIDVKSTGDKKSWKVETEEVKVKGKSQRRRYIRLDITSPVEIQLVVPAGKNNKAPGLIPYTGEVLNVSAGGVLIESDESLPEDSWVILALELNNSERVEGIVGRTKRSDEQDGKHLIGIEFCTSDDIDSNCPREYRSLLAEKCASFGDKVREVIGKYVFNESVSRRITESEK